jgi:hypothetical protein
MTKTSCPTALVNAPVGIVWTVIEDPRLSIPAEEVFKELRELRALPLEPAVWEK